jgi:hypothetical protein
MVDSAPEDEGLVKLFLDLPDNEVCGGESLWAKPVGPDLYEIRNVPFYAYHLHFNDVVRAGIGAPDEKPKIQGVVKRSGHKTLRVIFPDTTPEDRQAELLGQLRPFGATYERATNRYIAIDVEPSGNYQAVCDQLWAWEQDGVLEYETGVR